MVGNTKDPYIQYFEKVWSKNKAKGLAAQVYLQMEFDSGILQKHKEKFFSSCWITSPKTPDFYKYRLCTFVHEKTLTATKSVLEPGEFLRTNARPFYAISEFMHSAGIGVSYAIAITQTGKIDYDKIMAKDILRWIGTCFYMRIKNWLKNQQRNYSRYGGVVEDQTITKKNGTTTILKTAFGKMSDIHLEEMLLNELFYTGYMKSILKRPTNDPYDIDGFIMSLSLKHILPIELKEKFPVLNTRERYFGIDAGRIMMLLRLCIPNDTDALYIVREMDESGKFKGWKYITLSKILMGSSWNLQGGGIGMGGGNTQTVKIPYDEFEDLDEQVLDESNLKKLSNLPDNVKSLALEYWKKHTERFL